MNSNTWLVNNEIYEKYFEVEELDVLYGDYLFINQKEVAGSHIPVYKFPYGDIMSKSHIKRIKKLITRAIDSNKKFKENDIAEIVYDVYPDGSKW